MKIIGSQPVHIVDISSFKDGDLIVPNNGVMWSFYWKTGAILNPDYTYHIANSAQRSYFNKRIANGYKLVGAVDSHDYPIKNFNTYVINYKDL